MPCAVNRVPLETPPSPYEKRRGAWQKSWRFSVDKSEVFRIGREAKKKPAPDAKQGRLLFLQSVRAREGFAAPLGFRKARAFAFYHFPGTDRGRL
jgi:hypothetical protein